ncbi:MAG: uncharacterized protein KVP18_004608 [Porospora cf. gigantea A]|uniref:uncharacterized protein n=1 Tax=Porospora cf. gigantea A TaxID=2853593 RepID=UPI00355AC85E|nr:MAG: hypothetical protein KVP18_004608 [Porospora cf. gigantea A]
MSRQKPTPVRQASILAFALQKRVASGSTSPTSKAKMQDGAAVEVSPQRRKRLHEESNPAPKRPRVLFDSDDEVESTPSRTDLESAYSEPTPSGTDPSTSGASDWTASMGSQSPPHSASTASGARSHTAEAPVEDLQLSDLSFDPAAGGFFSHPPISLSASAHDETSALDGFLATLRAKSSVYSDSRYFREYLEAWTGYHRAFAFPSWLDPRRLCDAAGHSPTEACFAVESIRVPADFKREKAHSTPAMVQYWGIKATNFDKIVLFKIGKFYEIFYQDACIAHKYFDLKWMGSDGRPHVGFPEVCLNAKARDFVEAGFRVAVVEQLERPQELRERQETTRTKEKAVQRGLCEVLSAGVMLHAEQLPASARLVSFAYTVSGRVTFLSLDVASLTASFQSVATSEPLECVLDYVFRKAPVEVVLDRKTATPSLAKAFSRHPVNPVVSCGSRVMLERRRPLV